MRVTKITSVVVLIIYAFLWVIELHGATQLLPILAIPPILVILVAGGLGIQRFLGIKPRKQHFQEPESKDETAE